MLGLIIGLGGTALCFAASSREEEALRKRHQEELRGAQEQVRKMEERHLQELKVRDPKAYQERVRINGISQKVSSITASFRGGQLNESSARSQLTPLVRELLGDRIKVLDQEIRQVEKRLDYLRKAKANPDLLVSQQIDLYLGKGRPEEPPSPSFY